MSPFKKLSKEEIKRINRLQEKTFDELFNLFEPPLPKGVPERLERIVAAGEIAPKSVILDVGTGTGILIPLIMKYKPSKIYACDLSNRMLEVVREKYPWVTAIRRDIRDLDLPDKSLDLTFMNACYPNIVDKLGAFANLARMLKSEGRVIISHPMGRRFIEQLKKRVPFPLDDFPTKAEAVQLFGDLGFRVKTLIDKPELYVLILEKVQ